MTAYRSDAIAYTVKEKAAINDCYSLIQYAADSWDWTAPNTLREAFKSYNDLPATERKAHMIEAFDRGALDGSCSAASLYGLRAGWRDCYILGAAYAERAERPFAEGFAERRDRIHKMAQVAREAHAAALARFLARDKAA